MRHDFRRHLPLAAVITAGLVTLVGSGGGFPAFELDLGGLGPWVAAEMLPKRLTVQVGTPARFVAQTTHATQPRFQWCRVPRGGSSCETIAGATGDSYTLPAANLADDGSLIQVTVTDTNGTAYAGAALFVSSLPPVVFDDTDFATDRWRVLTVADPAAGGPSAAVATVASGGHPGAYRRTEVTVPAVPASIRVEQVAPAARYSPAEQGAIHVVDFSVDCVQVGGATSNAVIWTTPLIEQSGRVYVGGQDLWTNCSSDTWIAAAPRAAMAASDFSLVGGAACGSGEACPDFSVGGAPMQLGFAHITQASAAASPGSRSRGIDNWRFTVWRQ